LSCSLSVICRVEWIHGLKVCSLQLHQMHVCSCSQKSAAALAAVAALSADSAAALAAEAASLNRMVSPLSYSSSSSEYLEPHKRIRRYRLRIKVITMSRRTET
jgi:hypothetical protein